MSGPAQAGTAGDDLTADPGVLIDEPVFEVGGSSAAIRHGGAALLHWRSDALRVRNETNCAIVEHPPVMGQFKQAIVHIGKGRLAGEADLAVAWTALLPNGRLLVHGTNDVGIVSLGKRLGKTLQQTPVVLANRARARVLCFTRTNVDIPMPAATTVPLDATNSDYLQVIPGVFSGDGLDAGTALLQQYLRHMPVQLSSLPLSSNLVVDIGCGAGHLAFYALRLWPQATGLLVDGDRRAIRSAELNAMHLALEQRTTCHWWDVSEPLPMSPGASASVVLINPPCHAGTATDYSTARRMFQVAASTLCPGGVMVVVANRQLPYEADLSAFGRVSVVQQHGGFKLLSVAVS